MQCREELRFQRPPGILAGQLTAQCRVSRQSRYESPDATPRKARTRPECVAYIRSVEALEVGFYSLPVLGQESAEAEDSPTGVPSCFCH